MKWYLKVLEQYADFEGRARRQEFWMFVLINFLITLGLNFLAIAFTDSPLNIVFFAANIIYNLAVLIPNLAVGVRRLHDTNRSGWWIFISLIPVVGGIVLIVWLATEGTHGANDYGSDPKDLGAMSKYQDSRILDADL